MESIPPKLMIDITPNRMAKRQLDIAAVIIFLGKANLIVKNNSPNKHVFFLILTHHVKELATIVDGLENQNNLN